MLLSLDGVLADDVADRLGRIEYSDFTSWVNVENIELRLHDGQVDTVATRQAARDLFANMRRAICSDVESAFYMTQPIVRRSRGCAPHTIP